MCGWNIRIKMRILFLAETNKQLKTEQWHCPSISLFPNKQNANIPKNIWISWTGHCCKSSSSDLGWHFQKPWACSPSQDSGKCWVKQYASAVILARPRCRWLYCASTMSYECRQLWSVNPKQKYVCPFLCVTARADKRIHFLWKREHCMRGAPVWDFWMPTVTA